VYVEEPTYEALVEAILQRFMPDLNKRSSTLRF
jgi:hypothetical protein